MGLDGNLRQSVTQRTWLGSEEDLPAPETSRGGADSRPHISQPALTRPNWEPPLTHLTMASDNSLSTGCATCSMLCADTMLAIACP